MSRMPEMNPRRHPPAYYGTLLALILALAWGFSGCQTQRPTWIRTELFFGLTTSNGNLIAESDWNTFLKNKIVPRFPDGLTVFPAHGSWSDAQHITQSEPSRVIVILYPANRFPQIDQMIATVTAEYIHQFAQESILRSDAGVTTTIYTTSSPHP